MTITAKIIADSINLRGDRLTTMALHYPRFVHAEFMTHRVFSRNARSSRAVPTDILLREIENQPAMPVVWGKNQPGMQATENFVGGDAVAAEQAWRAAAFHAVAQARNMVKLGLHKQIVNRVIEPFTYIDVVVSSTEWENFYGLRCHKDAQPEIQALAEAMFVAHRESLPKLLKPGQWHLPYYDPEVDDALVESYRNTFVGLRPPPAEFIRTQVSVARCARVSYKAFDGTTNTIDKELELYRKLVGSQPLHASPAEHQATPDEMLTDDYSDWRWKAPHLHGNFNGWVQYRKTLPGEHVAKFLPYQELDYH